MIVIKLKEYARSYINHNSTRVYNVEWDKQERVIFIHRENGIEGKPFSLSDGTRNSAGNIVRQRLITHDLKVKTWREAIAKAEGFVFGVIYEAYINN